MALPLRRNTAELRHDRNHRPRQQAAKQGPERPVLFRPQIPYQPAVELFGRQRGLQVDVDGIPPPRHMAQMGAGAEDHRPRQAEMGEQHLPEVPVNGLLPGFVPDGQTGVFQR